MSILIHLILLIRIQLDLIDNLPLIIFLNKELFSLTCSTQAKNLAFRLFLYVFGEVAALSLNVHIGLHVTIVPGFVKITPIGLRFGPTSLLK